MLEGISHPYRLAMLYMLSHETMTPEEISRHLPMFQNLVSFHLKKMTDSGWLVKRRIGKRMEYTIHKKNFKLLPNLLSGTPFWRDLTKQV